MKIVVLAGGLSPERNVSLSSGAKVCQALRERGHQAAFVDLYFGTEHFDGPAQDLFQAPLPGELTRVARQAPDLEAVKRQRANGGESMFGLGVLELCQSADVVFLALHGSCGEDGRVQAALELLGVPYTGSGYLGSAIAMDKDLTKRLTAPLGVATPRWETVRYQKKDVPALSARLELPWRGQAGRLRLVHRGVYLPGAGTVGPGPGGRIGPGGPLCGGAVCLRPGDPGGYSGGHRPALH